jgi:hypothetical protein
VKPGDVVLIRFPQTDLLLGKLRPALIVAITPGRHADLLLALISSRTYQAVPQFDEIVDPSDADYVATGLKARSSMPVSAISRRNDWNRSKSVWLTGCTNNCPSRGCVAVERP